MKYNKDNVFYKIINKEIQSDLIYEDDYVIALNDIQPVAPVHVLVIPKADAVSFDDFMINHKDISSNFFQSVHKVANEILNLSDKGYRIITNHKESASQTVFHFHVHIISGTKMNNLI